MTDSMVETVARAMAAAKGDDPDEMFSPFGNIPGGTMERWRWHLVFARAAILAMREPTAEMVDAGRDIGPDAPYGMSETAGRYRAMIDTALKEPSGD